MSTPVDDVRRCVDAVEDPELPVPIGDLGMVEQVTVSGAGGAAATGAVGHPGPPAVHVRLVPTFSGCAAQLFIEADVRRAVEATVPGAVTTVEWATSPWAPDRVTVEGRRRLADTGVAVPGPAGEVTCPYCGSDHVRVEGDAGAGLCRRLAYCPACRNPVEVMKVPGERPVPVMLRGRS